jgi:prepilin peptidase CpaA
VSVTLAMLPDAIAILACAIATVTDQRRRIIPNELTFSVFALALLANAFLGMHAFVDGLLGAALAMLAFGLPAFYGYVGMGDVKLMVALGALMRWPLAGALVLYVAVAGGFVSAAYGLATRRVHQRMPYGLAIALGCVWAVASRYIDALRLV